MKPRGLVFYRGPSLLKPSDDIVAIATGLRGESRNEKTGPIVQVWILRPDLAPMDACRLNVDDAICGDCKFRGRDGFGRTCYVAPWIAPNNVFRSLDNYPLVSVEEAAIALDGRFARLGAYGDPAAVPFVVWAELLAHVAGWVGYTHAWRTVDPRMRELVMASVDSDAERLEAAARGWRTFRVTTPAEATALVGRAEYQDASSPQLPVRWETVCPASHEGGQRGTCETCGLCCGTWRGETRSIVIGAHGRRASFYRSSVAAAAGLPLARPQTRLTPGPAGLVV